MLKDFIKHLKCKHNYVYYKHHMIDAGMRKLIYYKCSKCGKEKRKVF